MITIQNGKLCIPDDDRFVGFAGDNAVNTKQFVLTDTVGTDRDYTLCLRFDDDTVRSVPLSASVESGSTVLTWEISQEHLYASGVVQAQVKITGSDGSTEHTTRDFFLIGSAVELDEEGLEAEYVTPSQLENSIQQAIETVSTTAPYLDTDGYWCVYDAETGDYVRTQYHVSGLAPDSAMSDSSDNTVANRVIKQYVDGKASDCNTYSTAYTDQRTVDKVPVARKIAQISLASDIPAADLMSALRPHLYKTNITPNSSGVKGQIGIGLTGEVFFCTNTDNWVQLASYTDLYDKMDLVTEVSASEMSDVDDGNIFFCGGKLYVKYDGVNTAVAKADDVYTKAEIDAMIGNLESLLASQ